LHQLAAAVDFNVSMVCTEAYALPYDNGDFANLHMSRRLITEIHAPHALAAAAFDVAVEWLLAISGP
jgi:hypothetical protein